MAVGAGALACGTFGEDDGSSGQAPGDAAASGDGTTGGDGATPGDDAGADGATTDGAPRPLGPCSAGGYVVCADFEQGSAVLQGGFTDSNLTGGGTLSVASQGPGHVLAVDTVPLASGVSGKASLSHTVTATPDAVTFEARIRMPTKIGFAEVLSLSSMAPQDVQIAIKLDASTQSLALFEDSGGGTHTYPSALDGVLGAEWVTVRVTLSFATNPMTVAAWLDGVVWVPKTPLVVLTQRPTYLFFGAGLVHARGPSPLGRLELDDVKLAFRAP